MVISSLIVSSACVMDPNGFYFNYEELFQNLSSVELIYYDSTYVYVDSKDEIEPFNLDKVTVIESLSEDKNALFCKSLSEIEFIVCDDWLGYNSSACGISLLLRFSNGNIVVMSDNHQYNSFVTEYDSTGKIGDLILCFSDSRSSVELINFYFPDIN